jgi:hypothetical protein
MLSSRAASAASAGIALLAKTMTSISPVKKGAVTPSRMMLTETAPEMVLTSQPKARYRGRIMTPGAARTPTPASVAENITARTIQA